MSEGPGEPGGVARSGPYGYDDLPADACGQICAVAGQGQRDLQDYAQTYRELFPAGPFDPAFFSTVALANTYCAPWLGQSALRMANRASLWAFAVDRMIDHLATTRAQVDDIVRRCLATVDGEPVPAGDAMSAFLAELDQDLATATGYAGLQPVWRDELRRMLHAMAREWDWKSARTPDGTPALPSFVDYMENTENFGFSFVYASHLAFTTAMAPGPDLDALRIACRQVQRVMRLLNDLGTYERDLRWGDLNALMLGVSRSDVLEHIAVLTTQARQLLAPLLIRFPHEAGYLHRQMEFNRGFYGITDYVGRP